VTPTSLARILGAAIDETPGAIAGSFAASDGETVESVAADLESIAFLTAHYAVVVSQCRAAFGVFHYGEVIELVIWNRGLAVVVRSVADGYMALLTLSPGTPIATAQRALVRAAERLRAEIA
jgi:hypothetical protein